MELIAEVEKHKMLWRRSSRNCNDKEAIHIAWEMVADKNGLSKADAKRKWRNLRDTFIRELRKYPKARPGNSGEYNGKWKFFSNMLFLRDEIILKSVNDKKSRVDTMDSMEASLMNCTTSETCDSNKEQDFDDPLDVDQLVKRESDTESMRPVKRSSDCMKNDVTTEDLEEYVNEKTASLHEDGEEAPSICSDSEIVRTAKKMKKCHENFQMCEFNSPNNSTHQEEREEESSLFLRSLNSYFRNFTPLQQVRVQGKILNIIMQEMENSTAPVKQ